MTVNKKETKEKQVRRYFAKTAAGMIHENGIKSVSVRKAADAAGYSMGSIYNHYKNLDSLLWAARGLLIMEIADHMERNCPDKIEDKQDVVLMFMAYMDYFIKNPFIYEFLYFYRLDQRDKASGLQDEEFELSKLFEPFLFFITKSCNKTQEEAVLLIKSMIYMVHGLLTLHLSGNDELTSAAMEMDLKEIISMLLS